MFSVQLTSKHWFALGEPPRQAVTHAGGLHFPQKFQLGADLGSCGEAVAVSNGPVTRSLAWGSPSRKPPFRTNKGGCVRPGVLGKPFPVQMHVQINNRLFRAWARRGGDSSYYRNGGRKLGFARLLWLGEEAVRSPGKVWISISLLGTLPGSCLLLLLPGAGSSLLPLAASEACVGSDWGPVLYQCPPAVPSSCAHSSPSITSHCRLK